MKVPPGGPLQPNVSKHEAQHDPASALFPGRSRTVERRNPGRASRAAERSRPSATGEQPAPAGGRHRRQVTPNAREMEQREAPIAPETRSLIDYKERRALHAVCRERARHGRTAGRSQGESRDRLGHHDRARPVRAAQVGRARAVPPGTGERLRRRAPARGE